MGLAAQWALLAGLPLVALTPGIAAAQSTCPADAVGCDAQDTDWAYDDTLFDGFSLDTGWVPGGSPLQVRVEARLAGETEVDLGATASTFWPPPLTQRLTGREDGGRLSFAYGFEFRVYFRFDVRVAGIRYNLEREIDIPSIPMDLLLAAEGNFTPFLFPPAEPFTLSDTTEPIPLLNADLGSLISLPGAVSGGFRLDVQGELTTSYQTVQIEVEDTLVTEADTNVRLPPQSVDGFGPARDVPIDPAGLLNYVGSLILGPAIYIEVAGRRFDLPVGPFEFELVDRTTNVDFDELNLHVPLPDIAVDAESLSFGEVATGAEATQTLRIENAGEATLEVELAPPAGVIASRTSFTIAPASRLGVDLAYTGGTSDLAASLEMTTNDPDAPRLRVPLSATAVMGVDAGVADAGMDSGMDASFGDAGVDAYDGSGYSGGACGCRVASNPRTPWPLLVGMAALVTMRRRRRGAR